MQTRGLVLKAPNALAYEPIDLPPVDERSARVRVAGCGVCHTDVSFYTGQVRTRHPLPLVLGHEISGTVVEAAPAFGRLVGRDVIIPAVIPCGACVLCSSGHDNACQSQVMPGNHSHGGFAGEVVVPARCLVPLGSDRGGYELADLAVVADAVTTPYQAIARAEVRTGDTVIIIGAGGIGTYAVQIALARGARVAVVDVDRAKLDRLRQFGVSWLFDPKETDGGAIKKQLASETGGAALWKIFEMSGTAAGQELAWSLLVPAATLGVIGFTMDKPQVRLSNLMALDATAFGNWGCSPALYDDALALVFSGKVTLWPFIERRPMSEGPALFERLAGAHDGSGRRTILIPE